MTRPNEQASTLSAKEQAALQLRTPNSGTEWLDDMIREANKDEAAQTTQKQEASSAQPASAKTPNQNTGGQGQKTQATKGHDGKKKD